MVRQACGVCLLVGVVAAVMGNQAAGQSLSDRIADYRQRQAAQQRQQQARAAARSPLERLHETRIPRAALDDVPARDALAWLGEVSGLPLVVHWDGLIRQEVDPQQPVSLQLSHVPAAVAMEVLLNQISTPELPVILEATPWYLEVLTREQANSRVVVRVYPIHDLLMVIPHFTGAPRFDLAAAIGARQQRQRSGGRSAQSSVSLFRQDAGQHMEQRPTRQQRGERIAAIIRDTIEPDIWMEHGGEHASIRYYDGRLIVTAPPYVHRQLVSPLPIGQPAAALPRRPAAPPAVPGKSSEKSATDVSSIQPEKTRPISARQKD